MFFERLLTVTKGGYLDMHPEIIELIRRDDIDHIALFIQKNPLTPLEYKKAFHLSDELHSHKAFNVFLKINIENHTLDQDELNDLFRQKIYDPTISLTLWNAGFRINLNNISQDTLNWYLYKMALYKHWEIVDWLLSHGAQISYYCGDVEDHTSPFMLACRYGALTIATRMLQFQTLNVYEGDEFSCSALERASTNLYLSTDILLPFMKKIFDHPSRNREPIYALKDLVYTIEKVSKPRYKRDEVLTCLCSQFLQELNLIQDIYNCLSFLYDIRIIAWQNHYTDMLVGLLSKLGFRLEQHLGQVLTIFSVDKLKIEHPYIYEVLCAVQPKLSMSKYSIGQVLCVLALRHTIVELSKISQDEIIIDKEAEARKTQDVYHQLERHEFFLLADLPEQFESKKLCLSIIDSKENVKNKINLKKMIIELFSSLDHYLEESNDVKETGSIQAYSLSEIDLVFFQPGESSSSPLLKGNNTH